MIETCEFPGCGVKKDEMFMTVEMKNDVALIICKEHIKSDPNSWASRKRKRRSGQGG